MLIKSQLDVSKGSFRSFPKRRGRSALKSMLAMFAMCTVLAGPLSATFPQAHAALPGSGSSIDPYIITACADLQEITASPDSYFQLQNDIDCSGVTNFPSVELASGTLDGQDYRILGLDRPLFHQIDGGGVNNLIIEDANISIGDEVLERYGVLARTMVNNAKINNVRGSGTLELSPYISCAYVGGLVGYMEILSTITNAHADVEIIVNDQPCDEVGGLLGHQGGGMVSYSSSKADLLLPEGSYHGGLVGKIVAAGSIERSVATGNVEGASYLGGMVGDINNGMVVNSYATGNVTGYDDEGVSYGGLVGRIMTGGGITDTYASGAVSGAEDVGGLIGLNSVPLTNSYALGMVSGDTNVGGLIGRNLHFVYNSAWVTGTASVAVGNDAGASTIATLASADILKYNGDEGVMAGVYDIGNGSEWNFDIVWGIDEDHNGRNNGFPYLEWEPLSIDEGFSGGLGTEEFPYLLSTQADLTALAGVGNTTGMYFNVINEISVDSAYVSIPSFKGNLNGQGYAIVGLETALMDELNGDVLDLQLTDVSITIEDGDLRKGALANETLNGTITDVTVAGTISIVGPATCMQIGGLAGYVSGTVIQHAHSDMNIDLLPCTNVGGLIGWSFGGFIGESSATGDIIGDTSVGGLIGYITNATTVTQSFALGNVTAYTTGVGGLVGIAGDGFVTDTVSNSYARGDVLCGDLMGYCVDFGGLVGNADTTSLENLYATGAVSGNNRIGGLIGHAFASSLVNSYAIGIVTGLSQAGAVVGQNTTSLLQNIAWVEGTAAGSVGAGGAPTGETQHASVDMLKYNGYTGGVMAPVYHEGEVDEWDFDGTWVIDSIHVGLNNGLPYLGWQTFSDLATYTLIFDEQGGSAVTDQTLLLEDQVVVLPLAPVRSGYTFLNWNTEVNGTGTSYAAQGNFVMLAEDTTLYAVWQQNTVPSSGGGGSGGGRIYDGASTIGQTGSGQVMNEEEVDESSNGGGGSSESGGMYAQEVAEVLRRGIITKEPDSKANKCEALQIFARVLNWDVQEASYSKYNDVPDWCISIAAFATDRGIVEGRAVDRLGLETPVTRFEVATMLYRELLKQGHIFTRTHSVEFTDTLVPWARPAVVILSQEGFIKGFADGTFGGEKGILKQDLGVMLLRIITQ